jgi:hypothetical protein
MKLKASFGFILDPEAGENAPIWITLPLLFDSGEVSFSIL